MQDFDLDDDLELNDLDQDDEDGETAEPDIEAAETEENTSGIIAEDYAEVADDDDEMDDSDDEEEADSSEDEEGSATTAEAEQPEAKSEANERLPRVRRPRRGKHRDDKTVSDLRREQAEIYAQAERDRIEQNNFALGWDSLASARYSNTILDDGIVGRVFTRSVNDNDLIVAEVTLERTGHWFKVLVPYEEFFSGSFHVRAEEYDLSTRDARMELTRQRLAAMRKFIGQKVPICILDMQDDGKATPEDHYIQGSRRKAMEILTTRYYVGTSRHGALVHVGSDVLAEVISISAHSVTMNVRGIDITVTAKNLTHRYMGPDDIRKFYPPGTRFLVRMEQIRTSEETMKYFPNRHMPSIVVSHKPIERENVPKQALSWTYGDNALARIVNIDTRNNVNRPIADIWIEPYNVPGVILEFDYTGLIEQGRTPQPGDRCVVYLGVAATSGTESPIISYDKGSNNESGVVLARFGRFID